MTKESHRRRVMDITGLCSAGKQHPEAHAKGASDQPMGAARLAGREALACPSLQRARFYRVPYTSSSA